MASLTRKPSFRVPLTHVVLLVVSVATLGPLLWLFSLSFKNEREFSARPFALPEALDLANYARILTDERMLEFIGNSAITTLLASAIVLAASVLAGYALARRSFKGARLLFSLFIISDAIPLFVVLVPLFVLIQRLGLSGTRWSLVLPYAAMNVGVSVFILRGFFRSISSEVEDAAKVDGCNTLGVLWYVLLPLVRPGLMVVIILNFIGFWNEYLLAAVLLPSQDLFTLPAGLVSNFSGRFQTNWPVMAAGIIISVTPTLALFALAQDKIIEGWTVALK